MIIKIIESGNKWTKLIVKKLMNKIVIIKMIKSGNKWMKIENL